jgi:hypothetical protein
MWDNFIGHQIRRCNRNLLIANVVLLCAVITCAAMSAHHLATEAWVVDARDWLAISHAGRMELVEVEEASAGLHLSSHL